VLAMFASIGAVLFGFSFAWGLYRNATADPLPGLLGAFTSALRNRFYFDELYEATFVKVQDLLAAIADGFDRWIIAGLCVRGSHGATELLGRALRLVQNGNLQTYAFLFVLGTAIVLYFAIGK
jgi:NADH-quinone oxidoreductase subunit L